MGLIKSANLAAAGATFAFADIERQAQAVLARAAQQAERMLAEAQKEADALRTQAVAEGKAAGHAQGQTEGHAAGLLKGAAEGKAAAMKEHADRLSEAVATFTAAGQILDAHIAGYEATAEEDLLRLAISIARRVVKTLADRDIAVVEANAREAVRLAMSKASLRIFVNPEQRAALTELLAELKLTFPSIQHLEFLDDASVVRGGCRVMTLAGEIDADIDRQLDRIAAELAPNIAEAAPVVPISAET